MAKDKAPALQLYVKDLDGDDQVSRLALREFGAWMRWLCAMWTTLDRGVLRECTVNDLARIARCTPEEADACVRRILEVGVADGEINGQVVTEGGRCVAPHLLHVTLRNANVTLINRRMVRDEKARKSCRDRVKRFRENHGPPCNAECNAPVTLSLPSASASCNSLERPRESRSRGPGTAGPPLAGRFAIDPAVLESIHEEAVQRLNAAAAEFGWRGHSADKSRQNRRNLHLALRDIFGRDGPERCRAAAAAFAVIWREKCKAKAAGESIDPEDTAWAQWRATWDVWPAAREVRYG